MQEQSTMETLIMAKRPRGRPRSDAPPRPGVHVRLAPALKIQLERDAKRAKRSVTKEIEVRLGKSYLSDEIYGGPEMAAMFRELAEVALGVAANQQNGGSFFDDFKVFVLVKDVWDTIIQRHMPRPNDELLAKVSQEWDLSKPRSPRTATQAAAQEWLIRHAPLPHGVTLAHLLAGAFGPAIGKSSENREPRRDMHAPTPELAATGVSNPAIGGLGQVLEDLTQSEGNANSTVWAIGGVANIMADLIRSGGSSARAAAGQVSRLAQLLAEAEDAAAGDTAVPRRDPDTDVGAMPK
jgi:hypothetical protein